MGYAFENTPWHNLPELEQIAVAVIQAQIRDFYCWEKDVVRNHIDYLKGKKDETL